jgi:hypothetical protein
MDHDQLFCAHCRRDLFNQVSASHEVLVSARDLLCGGVRIVALVEDAAWHGRFAIASMRFAMSISRQMKLAATSQDPRHAASREGCAAIYRAGCKDVAKLEAGDPGAMAAFAAHVGRHTDDQLASFLLNCATGTRIVMD